jgi:hypothetical protein
MQQSTKARLTDPKAKFSAPHVEPAPMPDPALMGQSNDVWGSVSTGNVDVQQGVVVVTPSQQGEPPRPDVVTVPQQARVAPQEPEPRTPDFSWGPQRQRSTEYQASPGFSPGPAERPPQAIVIRPSQDSYGDERRGTNELGGPARDSRYEPRNDPRYDSRADSRYEPRPDPRYDSRYEPRPEMPPPPPPARRDGGIPILRSY